MSTDPTRDLPPTYEQWIDAHRLDYGDLDTPNPGNYQTPARRRAERRKELNRP